MRVAVANEAQVLPKVVPALGDEVNQLFKDPSLFCASTVLGLLSHARTIGGMA